MATSALNSSVVTILNFLLQILCFMYDKDIIEEDAILNWEDEKRDADESDKVFVKQAQKFIQVSISLVYTLTCTENLSILHMFP